MTPPAVTFSAPAFLALILPILAITGGCASKDKEFAGEAQAYPEIAPMTTAQPSTAGAQQDPAALAARAEAASPAPPAEAVVVTKPTLDHLVVKGDSLWELASKYQTSVAMIKAANNLQSDRIVAGTTLKIPTDMAASSDSAPVPSLSVTPGAGTQPVANAPAIPPHPSTPPPAPPNNPLDAGAASIPPLPPGSGFVNPTRQEFDIPSIVPGEE